MTGSQPNLFLSNDVFFCYYHDDIVLLRLTANKYSQLHSNEATFLHQLARATAATTVAADTPPIHLDAAQTGVAQRLLDHGVLTRSRDAGRRVAPTAAAMPIEHLVDVIPQRKPPIRAAHVAAFVWAAVAATLDLARIARRREGFSGPVRRVQRRNARLRETARRGADDARDLVTVFNELRIYWPRKKLCRFDSLALIHFLGCFGLGAQWVFGVRLDPFQAHCWVQDERRLYNDDIERITQYQPIMVVS